jgi:uncharacterized membrane protein HdeD (DUF308 family)
MDTAQNSKKLIRSWWAYLLNGILFILLGTWMLTMPAESFKAYTKLIGIIVGAGGLAELIFSVYYRKKHEEWVWNATGGLMDLIIGALILFNPNVLLIIITLAISISLLFAAVVLIRSALKSNKEGHGGWTWKLVFGILIFLLAIVLLLRPEVLAVTMMIWMGLSFISLGVLRLFMAFQLHGIIKK